METMNELDLILKPSEIEGIGVFANRNIEKGKLIPWDEKEREINIEKAKQDRKLHELCDRFCVETETNYICPENFSKMSMLWFLNHSDKPNLKKTEEGFITMRDIKEGEELCINYHDLNSKVDNSNYMGEKF